MKALIRLLPILALGFVLSACATTDYERAKRRADARAHARAEARAHARAHRADHRPRRVTVCHKGKRTLRIDRRAARAHFRHGDRQGVCRQDRRHYDRRDRRRSHRNRR